MNALVFDIGGTNLRIGHAHGGVIKNVRTARMPKEYEKGLHLITVLRDALVGKTHVSAVVGGIAGVFSQRTKAKFLSTHLPSWRGKPIERDLARIFHAPVIVRNDCDLIGLGEALHGAGKGKRIVAYIGFGTGIGGTRVVQGAIDAGVYDFEPGHHFLNYDVRYHTHPSAHPGDWESLVSGTAMVARYGKKAEDIHNKKIWDAMAYLTALGLINVAMFWSPDIIIVGGSMMKSLSLQRIRFYANKHQKIFPQMPTIAKAALGDFGGLYGAMELARKL